jgi:hypothetical protein
MTGAGSAASKPVRAHLEIEVVERPTSIVLAAGTQIQSPSAALRAAPTLASMVQSSGGE